MVKAIDIQECKEQDPTFQVCAVFNAKTHPISNDALKLIICTFDDVEHNAEKKLYYIRQKTASNIYLQCLSNKDSVKLILDEFRKLLKFGSVAITEQRVGSDFSSVKYELTEQIKTMDYFDLYKEQLIQKNIPEKKAVYIINKVCNRLRKQPFCISGLYIEGLNFKLGCKTVECGQLIQETFTTYDKEKISFQFYFH